MRRRVASACLAKKIALWQEIAKTIKPLVKKKRVTKIAAVEGDAPALTFIQGGAQDDCHYQAGAICPACRTAAAIDAATGAAQAAASARTLPRAAAIFMAGSICTA